MILDFLRHVPKARLEARDTVDDPVDALLSGFPEENHERLLQRIEGKPVDEQVTFLEDLLRRRRELMAAPKYSSNRLHMISKVPHSVFERFELSEHQVEVGRGENGRVFEYVSTPEEGGSTVFKMLIRVPLDFQNDLLAEGAYQADVAALADEHTDTRVGVPHPYYIAASSKGYVLAMEKLPGHSINDILEKNIRLPDNFDYNAVQRALEEFVGRMNDAGFYHRDLREGNILIDPTPGNEQMPIAFVIDFGLCSKATSRAEAYQDLDGLQDHVVIAKVMDTLRAKQEQILTQGVST